MIGNEKETASGQRKGRRKAVDIVGGIYLFGGMAAVLFGLVFVAAAWIEQSYFTGGATIVGGLWVLAGLLWALVGRNLMRRRHWWFCFVIGLLTIPVLLPAGATLGIYTLVLLNRDETRSAFRK